MSDYRIYLIGTDGHIRVGHDFCCEADSEARAQALKLLAGYREAEVWQRSRRVCVVSANMEPARAA